MNKTILTSVLALALVSSARAQSAAPAPSGPLSDLTVQGTMDYESQYVFRGKKVTNSAFQPSVNFSYPLAGGSVNGYVWTSQPIGHISNPALNAGPNQTNEIDAGIAYTHVLSGISDETTLEVGYQLYWYPDVGGNTLGTTGATGLSRSHEFHIGATYDTTKVLGGYNLSPNVFYYHDVILDSNTFIGGVSYSWDLSDSIGLKGVSLNPSANLGYTQINRVFGDVNTDGFGNWSDGYLFYQINLELDYKFNPSTTAFLGVHYAGNNDGTTGGYGGLDSPFFDPQAPGTANNIWFGLGVKFNM